LKTPSNAQRHGLSHRNVGRSCSKKRHQDAKKGRYNGSVSIKSSKRETTFEELSNSDTESSVLKKNKRRNSHNSQTQEFKKDKLPTFYGEINK
jgi:hypothetical protein